MIAVHPTEIPQVAKKRKPAEDLPIPAEPFDRVEFQAPPSWVKELDAAAAALGMSRSAYLRMAANRQMQSDKRERGE